MSFLLTSSPTPSSSDERSVREAMGALPFVPSPVLAAMIGSSEADTITQMASLTVGPDALYHLHPIATPSKPETVTYSLSPLGATVTYASPVAQALVTARDAQFHHATCTTISPPRLAATTLAGFTTVSLLGVPGAELHFAGSGPEPSSLALGLPEAVPMADAFLRIVTPTTGERDLYFFAATSWDAMLPATERLRMTWDALRAEGRTESAGLVGWGYDAIAASSFWMQTDLPIRDDLRAHLQTTHAGLIPMELSDLVVNASPRRLALSVMQDVWTVEVPGNRARLRLDELPRCRLEVFDGGPEHPEGFQEHARPDVPPHVQRDGVGLPVRTTEDVMAPDDALRGTEQAGEAPQNIVRPESSQ